MKKELCEYQREPEGNKRIWSWKHLFSCALLFLSSIHAHTVFADTLKTSVKMLFQDYMNFCICKFSSLQCMCSWIHKKNLVQIQCGDSCE